MEKEIQGQTSLVRTQAKIVANELSRRLKRPAFAEGEHDLNVVIHGLRQFLINMEDLRFMREKGGW